MHVIKYDMVEKSGDLPAVIIITGTYEKDHKGDKLCYHCFYIRKIV